MEIEGVSRERQDALLTDAMCGCRSDESEGLGWHYVMGQCVGPYSHDRLWGDPLDQPPSADEMLQRQIATLERIVADIECERRGRPLSVAIDATHAASRRHPIEWPEDRS